MATQGCPRFSRSVAVRENVQCSAAERCSLDLSRAHRGAGTAISRCAAPYPDECALLQETCGAHSAPFVPRWSSVNAPTKVKWFAMAAE